MLRATAQCVSSQAMKTRAIAQGTTLRAFSKSADDDQYDLNRDVEVPKSEKRMSALLRRIADSIDAGKGWRITVQGVTLKVPENAECSVEHEREDGFENIELQFKWPIGAKILKKAKAEVAKD
mmetsp:Transcript_31958/g.46694  ORF Transcript_31958/g.46694 Transcript_31958/m.46694 type:complete len:123 (+) Transcript_31958:17-385(+)